jgi:hypothetical protein
MSGDLPGAWPGVERFEDDVLVLSLDRLVSVLRREAARRSGRRCSRRSPSRGGASVRAGAASHAQSAT